MGTSMLERLEQSNLFSRQWVRYSLFGALVFLVLFGFIYKVAMPFSSWYKGWYEVFRFIHHGTILALAIVIILFSFCRAGRKGKPGLLEQRDLGPGGKKWLHLILVVLILASVFGFYNYGGFHGNNYTHWWELIHYQFGSKYFPELGYDNLYLAFLAADRETGFHLRGLSSVRDLASNQIVTISNVDARIRAISGKFTPERWERFKREFAFYKTKEGRWSRLVVDHGYNPSPVWTVTGRFVTGVLDGLGFSAEQSAWVISRLDPLLLLLMFLLVWKAFGFEVMALAVAFWGANPLVMFDYTGGAFLRQDWLVALVAGIAFVRLQRPLAGGAFLAYAAGTRIFPGIFFLLPLLVLFRNRWLTKKWEKSLTRFASGGLAAGIILFGLSLQFAGGVVAWKTFLANAREHDKGVYTNHISYRNLFVYEYDRNARFFSRYGGHYHEKWREHKEQRISRLAPVYYGSIVLFAVGFFWIMRKRPWEEGMWASGFLPFLFFYPANYYYMFLLPLLFYAIKDLRLAGGLFGLMLLGFMGKRFIWGYDVYHIYLSLLIFLGFLYLLNHEWRGQTRFADKPRIS